MDKPIKLIIPGIPVACPRPRLGGRGVYYPVKYSRWKKAAVTLLLWTFKQEPLMECRLKIEFVFPRLKKHKKPGRQIKATRPDIDNLAKSVLDALQEARILTDDGKVYGCWLEKWYASENESAHIAVYIWE